MPVNSLKLNTVVNNNELKGQWGARRSSRTRHGNIYTWGRKILQTYHCIHNMVINLWVVLQHLQQDSYSLLGGEKLKVRLQNREGTPVLISDCRWTRIVMNYAPRYLWIGKDNIVFWTVAETGSKRPPLFFYFERGLFPQKISHYQRKMLKGNLFRCGSQ